MLRRHRIHRVLPLLVLMLITVAAAGSALAQTGSIRGVIRDRESGDLLDYANVLLVGSTRGTMSLGGGTFMFSSLAPGSYTVRVLYLGYAPAEKTVTVAAGGVQTLSFDLEAVVVQTLEDFDVTAEEYMVDIKDAKTEHTVTSETFEKYAIDSVEEALSKQAGVVYRAGELYVRGGRSGEVSMQIDGVAVDNPIGTGSLEVSSLAVESMAMATGGLDAKYGNALSGVVNITTKEGGKKFGGGVRFLTDDFGRQDKTFTNYDRLEYGFGGPSPLKGVTYYLAGDLQFSDTENTSVAHRPEYKIKLGDTTLFKFRRRQFNQAKGSAKLAWSPDEDKKVTAEYSYTTTLGEGYAPNWSVQGYARRVLYMPEVIYRSNFADWLATGSSVPVYYGPWYDTMLVNARTVMVVDTRNATRPVRSQARAQIIRL